MDHAVDYYTSYDSVILKAFFVSVETIKYEPHQTMATMIPDYFLDNFSARPADVPMLFQLESDRFAFLFLNNYLYIM